MEAANMDLMIMYALIVFLPPLISALIIAYLCNMDLRVFLGAYATGMGVVIGIGGLDQEWMVIPILILSYLIWSALFGDGGRI